MSPASGHLPGSGWRDVMECLRDRVHVVAFHAVVALDVEAELVCEVGNRGLGGGASVDGDEEAYGGVGAQPLSLILFAYILLLLLSLMRGKPLLFILITYIYFNKYAGPWALKANLSFLVYPKFLLKFCLNFR